eukprot:maker-scaffold96_size378025-snap-gene-2.47 protein:Tk04981 transcript:maker-scaffold96_size378025-snap-gene-2.47-mRNA-1 annotation:"domon domain-containing protein cg14681 precursor"
MISTSSILIVTLLAGFIAQVSVDAQPMQARRRNTENTIDVTSVGKLTRTQHRVSGELYIFNQTLLILDQFTFDGFGAGVYINIATKGNNRREWIQNREIVNFPSVEDNTPIERAFNNERLIIQLPSGVQADDIKWLSVWCEIFGVSFGEVNFPKA